MARKNSGPRWDAQAVRKAWHSRGETPGRGSEPQNQATSVPCSCLLHGRAPDSRNSGSLLPHLAFWQTGTQMAPCPDPKADISSYPADSLAAGGTGPLCTPRPSAVPTLPGSWPAAPLTEGGPGFGVWFMGRKYRFFIAMHIPLGRSLGKSGCGRQKGGQIVPLLRIFR